MVGGGGVNPLLTPSTLKSRHNLIHCRLIPGDGVRIVPNYFDLANMTRA